MSHQWCKRLEFTRVATPEENAYIEACRSIVQREVAERFKFESYYEALQTLRAYVDFYNSRRIHSGTGYKTPQWKWDEYEVSKFTLVRGLETTEGERCL